jgi:hypothetical protein
MFSLMKMFGKTKKSNMRKSKKSKGRGKSVRRTRRNRSNKQVKKGGMIPFI